MPWDRQVIAVICSFCAVISAVAIPVNRNISDSLPEADEYFTVTRADGTVLGPYKVRPFSHTSGENTDDYSVNKLNNSQLFNGTLLDKNESISNVRLSASETSSDKVKDDEYFYLKRENGEVIGPYLVKPFAHSTTEGGVAEQSLEIGNDLLEYENKQTNVEIMTNTTSEDVTYNEPFLEDENSKVATVHEANLPLTNATSTSIPENMVKSPPPTTTTNAPKYTMKKEEIPTMASEEQVKPKSASVNHTNCSRQLDEMQFVRWPPESFLVEGEPLVLECSIPTNPSTNLKIKWLFQRLDLPMPQCSLVVEETLQLCQDFATVEHVVDRDVTHNMYQEVITLEGLTSADSGYYMCLAELECDSNGNGSHTMNRLLKTEEPIIIYESGAYTAEMIALGVVIIILTCILVLGLYFQKKRRPKVQTITFVAPQSEASQKVLHAPLLDQEDSDSFDSDREGD